jgi:hypothetical protein
MQGQRINSDPARPENVYFKKLKEKKITLFDLDRGNTHTNKLMISFFMFLTKMVGVLMASFLIFLTGSRKVFVGQTFAARGTVRISCTFF